MYINGLSLINFPSKTIKERKILKKYEKENESLWCPLATTLFQNNSVNSVIKVILYMIQCIYLY